MFTTSSRSVNSKRWGVSAARSRGPMSGSSLIRPKVRSMTSRNSAEDLNSLIANVLALGVRRAHRAATIPPVEASRASLAPGGQRPIHLHPVAPLAERALLPGDPARALLLAGLLTERPIMFNHHR